METYAPTKQRAALLQLAKALADPGRGRIDPPLLRYPEAARGQRSRA
jgi:hypothetical protein